MSRFGGGPSGLQGVLLALSSKIKTLWRQRNIKKSNSLAGFNKEHFEFWRPTPILTFVSCVT